MTRRLEPVSGHPQGHLVGQAGVDRSCGAAPRVRESRAAVARPQLDAVLLLAAQVATLARAAATGFAGGRARRVRREGLRYPVMIQDYLQSTNDQVEEIERATLRTVVQAVQQYSAEARHIFENTSAPSDAEIVVLAEDLVQYSLEVAELFPINLRFAGFIDYKRVRWLPMPFGLIPQAFLVDAKASTENNRETLQQSQLPMDADFESRGKAVHLAAGVPPHLVIKTATGGALHAITTSVFVHFHYTAAAGGPPYRTLHGIYCLAMPHSRLKGKYNPSSATTFFGQGKHSPARGEEPRIRIYFSRLVEMCRWRLQVLEFLPDEAYSTPIWRDTDAAGHEVQMPFEFLGR